MYNQELKNNYLSVCKSKKATVNLFKKSKPYEKEFNADLSMLDISTVTKIIVDSVGYNSKSAYSMLIVLKQYCLWCKRIGLNINQDLLDLKIKDQSIGAKRQLVASPERLKSILDIVFSKPEDETEECLVKCYLWCAFFGVPVEDSKSIFDTMVGDLDLDNKIIVVANRPYEMYEESIPDFMNLKNLEAFAYHNRAYKNKTIYRRRINGEYLFRGTYNKKNTTGHIEQDSIKVKISKHTKHSDRKLRYSDIYLSGIFYRAYQLEKDGFVPDFTSYLKSRFGDINPDRLPKNTDYDVSKRTAALSWYRNLLNNYETWKKAFRLK